jgi:hypothetical protein
MIFSTDKCPLCNLSLNLEIFDGNKGKVWFKYSCTKTEDVYNSTARLRVKQSHYMNDCFQGGSLVTMVIGQYEIFHSESNNMTSVCDAKKVANYSEKLIFRTKLLDLDYSQPHVVLDKLKLLVTFS